MITTYIIQFSELQILKKYFMIRNMNLNSKCEPED